MRWSQIKIDENERQLLSESASRWNEWLRCTKEQGSKCEAKRGTRRGPLYLDVVMC